MNTDIRLSVGFWQHPKTKKTLKRLGFEGIRSLQILWMWVAMNRPDGNLYGMSWEDIELAGDWTGEEKSFFDLCIGEENVSMWIDVTDEGYVLHGWEEHNPWVAKSDVRSDKARFSRLATINREAYEELKSKGIGAISKKEYEELTNVGRIPNDRLTNVERSLKQRLTPAPSPIPAPSPTLLRRRKSSEQSLISPEQQMEHINISTFALPLNTGEEYLIASNDIEQWKELYPSVDVFQELRNMRGWLIGNPKKRKTKAGIGRFIQSWLSKSQDKTYSLSFFSAKPHKSFAERRQQENEEASKIAKEMLFGREEEPYAEMRL